MGMDTGVGDRSMETMTTTKKRIEWVDIGKYICIMFVMLSHLESTTEVLDKFYSPFFLTVFFFLSGYVYRQPSSFKEHMDKKIKIDAILRSADTDTAIEAMIEPYRIEGRELLNRMNEIYEKQMATQNDEHNPEGSAGHWAELERCEQRFQEIMAAVDKARLALSLKNLWLMLFRDAEIPETLARKDVKTWISAVTVKDYQKVTVTFQKQDWKELLPQEWLAQEDDREG